LLKDRTIVDLFGKKRLFLGPIIPHYPDTPKSACEATYREAFAHLPQSTTAGKINRQGIELIYYNQGVFKHVELLAQIHDSIVFQIPLSQPWDYHANVLLKIKASLEQPLYWHGRKIPTPADIAVGKNMCKEEMIEIKSKDVPSSVTALSNKLENIYSSLEQGGK
jgi:hypothetical protein